GELDVGDVPVREAHAAHVVQNHPPSLVHGAIGALSRGRPAAKVSTQVAEDVGREDDWWTIAEAHIRDADAVARCRVLHWPGHGSHGRNFMACEFRLPGRAVF